MIPLASRTARGVRAAVVPRRPPAGFCGTISLLGLVFAAGCSSAGSPEAKSPSEERVAQLERDNTQLNDRLVRAERERDEAMRAARQMNARQAAAEPREDGADAARGVSPEPTQPAEQRRDETGRPALTIVKLGPEGTESVVKVAPAELESDEEEPEPRLRPVLRVYGSEEGDVAHVVEGESAPPAKTSVLADERDGAGSAEGSPSPSVVEKKKMRAVAAAAAEYEAALSVVRQKNWAKAEPGLRGFLVRHPDHPYSDNALYWLGECAFQRGDYASARDSFANVEARYPGENKVPDALLKLALSHERLGQADDAKKAIGRLLTAHPDTAAARRIPETYSSK